MKRLTILLLILICFACTVKPDASTIQIKLINNNQSLKITGLNNLIVKDIARDTTSHWESLFPIYRMPADTDLKDYQQAQPGRYLVAANAVIFIPDTPFLKHQTYFIRYYQYGEDNNVWDFIKGKKQPGKIHFIDLIFKP
ncbi:MAG: hypothetical protein JWQ06_1299 [Mucilaginibacter sp.]|nr:hypothetical protein [Mucilaginibacter sp.]